MNKYILDLKTDKVKDLWLALSERDFLCFDKKSDVKVNFKKKVKGKSSGKMPFKSRARLYSALNRIEDTLEYMNTISLGSTINKRAAFDFYDFINNECVVIDCIEKVAEIFGMNKEIAELKKTNEIFKMKGTDNDFVKISGQ